MLCTVGVAWCLWFSGYSGAMCVLRVICFDGTCGLGLRSLLWWVV